MRWLPLLLALAASAAAAALSPPSLRSAVSAAARPNASAAKGDVAETGPDPRREPVALSMAAIDVDGNATAAIDVEVKDQQDNLMIWILLFSAAFCYCTVFWSAYAADRTEKKDDFAPPPALRFGQMGGWQKKSPAAQRDVANAQGQFPTISHALLAQRDVMPLAMPLGSMHNARVWCETVASSSGVEVLKARMRAVDRGERLLEIIEASSGVDLASVNQKLQVMSTGGHGFGQLVEMNLGSSQEDEEKRKRGVIRFELREFPSKPVRPVRIAVEYDPTQPRFEFLGTMAGDERGGMSGAWRRWHEKAKRPAVACADRRRGKKGDVLELRQGTGGEVDPVLILACTLALLVWVKPR